MKLFHFISWSYVKLSADINTAVFLLINLTPLAYLHTNTASINIVQREVSGFYILKINKCRYFPIPQISAPILILTYICGIYISGEFKGSKGGCSSLSCHLREYKRLYVLIYKHSKTHRFLSFLHFTKQQPIPSEGLQPPHSLTSDKYHLG